MLLLFLLLQCIFNKVQPAVLRLSLLVAAPSLLADSQELFATPVLCRGHAERGTSHRPLQRSALAVAACCSQPVAGEDVDLLSSSTWLPGSGLNDLRTAWPSLLTDLHALNPKPQTPN